MMISQKPTEVKSLLFFILLTFIPSFWLYFHYSNESYLSIMGITLPIMPIIMWIPGIAAIMATLLFKYPLNTLGLLKWNWRFSLLNFGLPIFVAISTLCLGNVFGIISLQMNPDFVHYWGNEANACLKLLTNVQIYFLLPNLIYALGEELGWRGFLQERLKDANFKYRSFCVGSIWALWHLPLYLNNQTSVLKIIIFCCMVILLGFWLGWLREYTKSLWPAVIFHAVHNTWFNGLMIFFIPEEEIFSSLFFGEEGLFCVLLYLITFTFIFKIKNKNNTSFTSEENRLPKTSPSLN